MTIVLVDNAEKYRSKVEEDHKWQDVLGYSSQSLGDPINDVFNRISS